MKSCRCRAGGLLAHLAELEGILADLLVACVRGSPVRFLFRVLEEVVEVLEDVVVVLMAEAEGVENDVG